MESAALPRVTVSANCLRLRPTIISCAASLLRYCSPLIFHKKPPGRFSRARRARVQDRDLALPLGIQEMIVGSNFFRFYQVGVVPERFSYISRKTVDVFPRVIGPDMPAPPILCVSNFGQQHPQWYRRQQIL